MIPHASNLSIVSNPPWIAINKNKSINMIVGPNIISPMHLQRELMKGFIDKLNIENIGLGFPVIRYSNKFICLL